jgi:predicted nucleotidyltransferase
MHIYAYGSICRGEIEPDSDVDLLAIIDDVDARIDTNVYSVYPYARLNELWAEGNPFAWHLHLESRLVFAEDGVDFVRKLGAPRPYEKWRADSEMFRDLYTEAYRTLSVECGTTVFELSTIFLSIRNLAICYSLHLGSSPVFSRRAFEKLGGDSLNLDTQCADILDGARILSTRGQGPRPSKDDVAHVLSKRPVIDRWISGLVGGRA